MPIRFPGPPPREALEFFRAKDLRVGFDHRDVWGQEHAHAFTVAKAMRLDVLDDIRTSLDEALAEGKTFRDFAGELKPRLQVKGWWGRTSEVDPLTGERREVQLGSPRRLKTIYRSNLRAARAAGQWERAQRTKASHPYLLYELGPSERHREEHVGWAGTLLPIDDPWWQDHAPPNDYGCKCRLRQVSGPERERLIREGVQDPEAEMETDPATGLPTGRRRAAARLPVRTQAPARRPQRYVNKRSGEVTTVDAGLNPAWARNPGLDRAAVLREELTQRIDTADQRLAQAAVENVVRSPVLDGWLADPRGEIPAGVLTPPLQAALGSRSRVVRLSIDTLDEPSRTAASAAAYRLLPGLLASGRVVRDGEQLHAFARSGDIWRQATVRTGAEGRVYLSAYRQVDAAEVERVTRRGEVLRP